MKPPPVQPKRSSNSWRDLVVQPDAPQAETPISQKRHTRTMIKRVFLAVFLCALVVGGIEVYTLWQNNPANVKAPVEGKPLKTIVFRSNGVLDHAWVVRTLALPAAPDMMKLDITALRQRLLATPQVRTASLTRQFPDTLAITIEERYPVARLLIQQPGGEREELLVANDGSVYSGVNYSADTLVSLPYLADVNLLRTAPGAHQYLPLDGIEFVARLVAEARDATPGHYATWSSISLKRYDEDRLLIVNTNRALQITFGLREEFRRQLARLDLILDDLARSPERGYPSTIDLSVGQTASGIQVPVAFHQR